MSLPPGFVEELQSRVSLARVVGRKVSWDPRKSNAARGDFWAPCPFHQEKTASFHVDEAKGYYYCFGCHAKGDAISFMRETENLGFIEAVELLAGEAGMPLPERDPAAAARAAANQGLVEAMEAAVRFYRAQLSGARAAPGPRLPRPPRPRRPPPASASRSASRPTSRTAAPRASDRQGLPARAPRRGRPRRHPRRRRQPLRPLPRPDHVPDPRRARPRHRLRRPRHRRRAGAEVPELPRHPALRQGPHPLQRRPGPRRRRQGRHASSSPRATWT